MSLIGIAWFTGYVFLLVVILSHRCDKAPLRIAVLLALVPSLASAQLISIGVTGGIPISPHSKDYGEGCLVTRSTPDSVNQTTCGPNRLFVKPYALGPTLGFHFPWHLSVDAGMLYQRLHRDVSQGLIVIRGGSAKFGQYFSASANAWLFPLQLSGPKPRLHNRLGLLFRAAGKHLRAIIPQSQSAILAEASPFYKTRQNRFASW